MRFSEETWSRCKIDEVVELTSGQDFPPALYSDISGIFKTPYLTGASCIDSQGIATAQRWTNVPRCIVNEGDILIVCKGSGSGRIAICGEHEAHIARQFMSPKPIDRKLDKSFLSFYCQRLSKELAKKATGLIEGIDRSSFLSSEIAYPSIGKQLKIAYFLKAVEKRIVVQNKIIEGYKRLKDGALRRLFPSRGKCQSGIEEPLTKYLTPGSKTPVDPLQYRRITIHLNYGGLSFSEPDRELKDTRPFFVRRAGELIIGKQNYFNGSICLVADAFDMTVCSNAIMSFKINGINPSFLLYATSNKAFLEARSFYANGTGQKELSENDFLNFTIVVPSPSTQEAITKAILSIEKNIEHEERILSAYSAMKIYLLQNMFI